MSTSHLRKAMGFPDLVLFYLVTALSLRWIATAAAAGPSSIVVWIAGCLTYFIVIALAGLALGFILNLIGLNIGKWLHNIGAIGTWLPAMMLIVMGSIAWFRFGSATSFGGRATIPSLDLKNIFFWSTVAFAFGGMEGASTMGDEIQNARRNIPRALLTAGVIITIIYIAATASVLAALPAEEVSGLQGFMQAMSKVAGRIGLDPIAPVAAVLVTLSSI